MTKVTTYVESELVFAKKPEVHNFRDLTGLTFDRFVVLGFAGKHDKGVSTWYCKCKCGVIRQVRAHALNSKRSKSCGCLTREASKKRNTSHGHCKNRKSSRTYRIWVHIHGRCKSPNYRSYPNYGGRGITICERWSKFENFLADMGECPNGLSIDRINNNGNYEPGNCRWATPEQQCNNTRMNKFITFNDETLTIRQWERKVGFSNGVIWNRIYKKGWDEEKAIITPVKPRGTL